MASINRDPRFPKGVFYARYTLADGTRATRSTGKTNRREADIICQALQAAEDEAAGRSLTRDRVTAILNETLKRVGLDPIQQVSVSAWLNQWTGNCEHSTKPATLSAYKQVVQDFLDFIGPKAAAMPLASIALSDVNRFKDRLLAEGRSPATVNKLIKKFLNTPFELARKSGKIQFNPINLFKPLKYEAGTKGRFSSEQVARLLAACADFSKDESATDWRGAILFAYGSGARLQDVANLHWSNVDLQNGLIQFRQRKSTTGAKALLGIHPDFEDWLIERPGTDKEGPVFPSLANRSGSGRNGLSKAFDRIMERAGIKSALIKERPTEGKGRSVRALSFHSFRHNVASELFNSQAIKEIARRVTQHAPDGSIDRYLHADTEAIKAAVQLIPRLPKRGHRE
jgi:integrase